MRDNRRKDSRWMCFAAFLLLPAGMGCSSELAPQEYIRWVESYDHGFHVRKVKGPFTFDLQYKPAPYVLLQQQGASAATAKLDSAALKEAEQMQYYTLTVGLADGKGDFLDYRVSSVAQQQQKLYYFSYLFGNDVHAEENGQQLPCLLFHFERSYDLKPTRTFVLGFNNPAGSSAPARLVIDSPWLETGPVELIVDKKNIPTIKL